MRVLPPQPRERPQRQGLRWLAVVVVCGGGLFIAMRAGCGEAAPPARCPHGTSDTGGRCCLMGQRNEAGLCLGVAAWCPDGFRAVGTTCAVVPHTVEIGAGRLLLGPGDWEAQGVVEPRDVVVERAFRIDATEVTVLQWGRCVAAGACAAQSSEQEPGLPVRGITFLQAESYCRWAGGHVPHEDQWLLAAAGPVARRYPWGDSGAVCRRACWGLLHGPCARGGRSPELAGLPPEDTTPAGVQGMAGGVAEWVRGSADRPVTRGGSWRSKLATELRTWQRVERAPQESFDDVGVRCAYAIDSDVRPDPVLPPASP
ncbi:MAG: formylglycine-generating enzyme family protein [Polyangiaceae bacterium]|jgi:formylglycine-generating enzyme required for sulfatase activity|nr:formylglycine-generating enzyme family protein [Polyangiaceae bacterium]